MCRIAILAATALLTHAGGDVFPSAAAGAQPYTHELTFHNDTFFAADGLSVELSAYTWQVDVLDQPDRCPEADAVTFGFSLFVSWAAACVRPGDSVTLLLYGECDDCPPPEATATWVSSVGGIAQLPHPSGDRAPPLQTAGSSHVSAAAVAGMVVGAAVVVAALGAAGWYARRLPS